VKRRSPWGERQLRDSWSEDAMSFSEKDSLTRRIHSQNRFHPMEMIRLAVGGIGILFLPMVFVVGLFWVWYISGRSIYYQDWQQILSLLRLKDISPRSSVARGVSGNRELPDYIIDYRIAKTSVYKRRFLVGEDVYA